MYDLPESPDQHYCFYNSARLENLTHILIMVDLYTAERACHCAKTDSKKRMCIRNRLSLDWLARVSTCQTGIFLYKIFYLKLDSG